MLTASNPITLVILICLCFTSIIFLNYIMNKRNKKQLDKIFIVAFSLEIFWMLCLILQIFCIGRYDNISPIYFEYFSYISVCFLPVAFLFMSLIFSRTRIKFSKKYMLLFIIPITSILMIWTNNIHHLFFKEYSIIIENSKFGSYFYIHSIYSYLLYIISLFILIKYSIKNSGLFSKQAVLIFIGVFIPIITNTLGLTGIINISIYITPITFAVSIICFALALFRFSLFKATPIALQRIVDRISDSYVVLNDDYTISDFNQTFINTFNIKNSTSIRGSDFSKFLKEIDIEDFMDKFKDSTEKVIDNNKTISFEIYIDKIKSYFNVEITSITINAEFLGFLILFKDITQHIKDMKNLEDNQDLLIEQERLASLGQMIGGIAHNLKTPIMSIAGAAEGLSDLIKEYDASIDDPEVNSNDHHEIASDMKEWVGKIKTHTEYMSDVITAVKGQAVALSNEESVSFTIEELIKKVNILMKHELKNAICYLNISMRANENLEINGDVNSLVQIVNNMISNSIQAYNGKLDQNIDMIVETNNNNLLITIKDNAGGLPEKVKKKLFKEMITTKGKNGTGLGLYMSYSTIKARFGGNITVETETGKGTAFTISIPM